MNPLDWEFAWKVLRTFASKSGCLKNNFHSINHFVLIDIESVNIFFESVLESTHN